MESENKTLDISRIVELKKIELSITSPIEIQCLEVALQSIAKRIEYCKYHYDEFIANSDSNALFIDRFDSSDLRNISIRTKYEANTVAFLQNLHALVDSFPYVLNIITRVVDDIESSKIGWNKEFIKKYTQYDFYNTLSSLSKNETFQMIKGLVNRTKHKHLVRIRNNTNNLIFDEFTYFFNGEVKSLNGQDVKSFVVSCHDELFPKFLSLFNEIKNHAITQK